MVAIMVHFFARVRVLLFVVLFANSSGHTPYLVVSIRLAVSVFCRNSDLLGQKKKMSTVRMRRCAMHDA